MKTNLTESIYGVDEDIYEGIYFDIVNMSDKEFSFKYPLVSFIYPVQKKKKGGVFKRDEVFKHYTLIDSITHEILTDKHVTMIKNQLSEYKNSDRNMLKLFICGMPLKYTTKRYYIKHTNKLNKKWWDTYRKLFFTGVPIDMTHTHGGPHNSYTVPHISHEDPTPVKWLAHFLGIPYGSTLTFHGRFEQTYLKFDSSGLDTPRFPFLDRVLGVTCTTGKRGFDLFHELGPVVVWTPNRTIYDFRETFKATGDLTWTELDMTFHKYRDKNGGLITERIFPDGSVKTLRW